MNTTTQTEALNSIIANVEVWDSHESDMSAGDFLALIHDIAKEASAERTVISSHPNGHTIERTTCSSCDHELRVRSYKAPQRGATAGPNA